MIPASTQKSSDAPCALIVGHTGQDGSYLSELLEAEGHRVIGLNRAGTSGCDVAADILDQASIVRLIAAHQPAEVYYLAAYHHSSQDPLTDTGGLLRGSMAVHVDGLVNVLDAILAECPETRLFYAASSHVFGDPADVPQTETTPFAPTCPYGISKAAGAAMCRLYRERHGLFCSVGILYNHESPRRTANFVGRKITQAAARISRGQATSVALGDLSAAIDWGAAPDYVDAMRRILGLDVPDDFIIASGETHTIGELVDTAFSTVGLDGRAYVTLDPSLITKHARRRQLVGDASKLRSTTGWRPKFSFTDLVRHMVEAELATGAA